MQERKPLVESTELLRRISRLSSEAEWRTEELQEALRAGGVNPERLVSRVLTEVQRLLTTAGAARAGAHPDNVDLARPLLGVLQAQTQLPPGAIAQAMDVPVTFLAAVSRYPRVVPLRWRQELATRAERALQVRPQLVMESLTRPFQYEMAASRDAPYSTEAVQSYEDILTRATMSEEAKQYWRTLAMGEAE
jgi:hypothetical protein